MPKIFAKTLGLKEGDDLYKLASNPNSFTERFVKNLQRGMGNPKAYTIAFKRFNGDHVYVLDKEQFKKFSPIATKSDLLLDLDPIDGKFYRVDSDNNKLYPISSKSDQLYVIDGKEVIVTDNTASYIDNLEYNTIDISKKALNRNSYLSKIKKSTNPSAKRFNRRIKTVKDLDVINNVVFENGEFFYADNVTVPVKAEDSRLLSYIRELGGEIHTSFKKSLEILAARIPAQCMQSFMPMKVVGFEDLDINTAYVSTHQIWLQGSDYDIDAVSLLSFVLGKSGKFIGWSPYFDISTEEKLKDSCRLGYPTGENVTYWEDNSKL
jgi:hypothetical protein